LWSLREDDAFAGNGAGDKRYILRQTAALYFLYGVHGGDAEDGCSAFAGFFDDPGNLFTRDERADSIVNRHEFHVIADVLERGGDGLLPGGAAFYDANCLAEFFLLAAFLHALHFIGASGEDDFGDGVAGSEAAQGVKKDGDAVEFKKLFGRFAAHARAHSSSGQDGSDSGHLNMGDGGCQMAVRPSRQEFEFTLSRAVVGNGAIQIPEA
jgi:hypothetical protein